MEKPGDPHREGTAEDGPQEVDPEVPKAAGDERWSERSGWVHRGTLDGQGDQAAQRDRGADSQRRLPPDDPAPIGGSEDDRHEEHGQEHFDRQGDGRLDDVRCADPALHGRSHEDANDAPPRRAPPICAVQ